jgi:diadenosine tetraphosphate (Ap4A) HIT family hydrolase
MATAVSLAAATPTNSSLMSREVRGMECQFCTEFADISASPRIVVETDGWVLLPTVGCFTPGYCLFMPIRHIDAAADAPMFELARIQDTVEGMRTAIASVFGPTVIAEHGPRGCQLGASCCSHAHLHLIPVPDPDAVTGAYRMTGGPGRAIRGIPDLAQAADDPYLYLSPQPGVHMVWPASGFARQYVRRVCASLHGIGEYFDWRDHPFTDNQTITISALQNSLKPWAA